MARSLENLPEPATFRPRAASASSRTNRNGLLVWERLPLAVGPTTEEVTVRLQRDRFFGSSAWAPIFG